MVAAGAAHTVGLKADGTVLAIGNNDYGQLNIESWTDIQQIAAGGMHTVGLKADGTVVAVGDNSFGQLNVESWTDIQQIAAGFMHTVGLKADGTVVAVGDNSSGQLNVGSWTGIAKIAAGLVSTLGVKADGTVVAVGDNSAGQLNSGSWTGITQVATGYAHTVGLKADGTVVAVGLNNYGQLNVESWTDIRQISVGVGSWYTVGLRADGTVVAVGDNSAGQLNIGSWTGITQVTTGNAHTVGLKADGTVVAVGDNSYGQSNFESWAEIQQVAAGGAHTVGLRADGTVLAIGENTYGQLNVENWTDIRQVTTGLLHTVGLKMDGTVVAAGSSIVDLFGNISSAHLDVSSWADIQQVATGLFHTVGLKADGTVVAVGLNYHDPWGSIFSDHLNVGSWTGIQQVAAGNGYTMGLKADGTLIIAGMMLPSIAVAVPGESISWKPMNEGEWTNLKQVTGGLMNAVGLKEDGGVVSAGDITYGQLNVESWMDIQQVATFMFHTVGLKTDGTVVAVGNNDYGQLNVEDWTNIQQVAAGGGHIVGLREDGTLVAVGDNSAGQLNVNAEEWFLGTPAVNNPPIADANGPYTIDEGETVTLDASGSYDPDEAAGDSIISYEWDLDNDGQFDDATGASPTIPWATIASLGMTYPADPTTELPNNTIRLRVTDTFGATSTSATTLTIYDNEPFASFTASPNPTAPGQVITFDASDSSHGRPDRSIVLYEWDFDYDGTTFNIDASGVEVTHAYATFGSYTVALRVTDDNSPPKTDTTTTVIDINQGNQPPVADPNGPYIVDQGDDVALDASGSYDPDEAAGDSIISYEWDLDNNGQFNDATGTTPTISWATITSLGMAYPADPTIGLPNNTIRLRVTDTFGATSTSATTLTIYDNQTEAPTVTTDAASGVSGMVATLNGTVNANGFSTTVTFEYGLTTAYGTIVTADQSPVTGDTGTAVSKTLSDLTTKTTYHYRVVATNAGGTTYGADMTFTTKSGEPASGKAYGKDDAPGQNKEPGEPADGKGDAPGQNKEPGEPADGKAYGNDHASGQNKEPGEPADGKGDAPGQNK